VAGFSSEWLAAFARNRWPASVGMTGRDRSEYANNAQFTTPRGLQEKACIEECKKWWKEIDSQLRQGKAIVYIPDICIAEAFKVLAKMYYRRKVFPSAVSYNQARNRLSGDITTPIKDLKLADRQVRYHDISTSRDIIIAVDRFLEVFMKKNCRVSLPDLIVLATAKYLIDFFRIPHASLFIITLDKQLHRGSRLVRDIT